MTPKINLVANRNNQSAKQKKVLLILQVCAAGSLAVVLLTAVGLFLYKQKLNSDIASVDASTATDQKQLETLHPRLAKLFILNDRTVNIKNILANRTTFETHIEKLLAHTPDAVSYQSLSLQKGQITMSVSSQSLGSVNDYINNLITMVKNKDILKSIKLESLDENTTSGTYTVSLSGEI